MRLLSGRILVQRLISGNLCKYAELCGNYLVDKLIIGVGGKIFRGLDGDKFNGELGLILIFEF